MSDADLYRIEQQLGIDQMTINVEKMRSDMRWDMRKFVLQMTVPLAAAGGAGAALATYLTRLH